MRISGEAISGELCAWGCLANNRFFLLAKVACDFRGIGFDNRR